MFRIFFSQLTTKIINCWFYIGIWQNGINEMRMQWFSIIQEITVPEWPQTFTWSIQFDSSFQIRMVKLTLVDLDISFPIFLKRLSLHMKFFDFISISLNRSQSCARFEIILFNWCIDAKNDLNFFSVFDGFKLRITIFLFFNGFLPVFNYLYPNHSISFLANWHLDGLTLKF